MTKKEETVDYEVFVNQIIQSFAKEMEKDFELVCIGNGGKMPHDVEEISVKFIAYRRATIEQARELEVNATETFLRMINAHEKIRPFLREYPFKVNRAEVSIAFRKNDNSAYDDSSVVHVFQVKNRIFYYAEEPNSGTRRILLEESYEEAVKIVKENPPKKDSPVQHPV
ncbi:MAG: hypothetical protein WCP39_00395 [Chlamydiota bacterium]